MPRDRADRRSLCCARARSRDPSLLAPRSSLLAPPAYLGIADLVPLVEHGIAPAVREQRPLELPHAVIRRHARDRRLKPERARDERVTRGCAARRGRVERRADAVEHDRAQRRRPARELGAPVQARHGAGGDARCSGSHSSCRTPFLTSVRQCESTVAGATISTERSAPARASAPRKAETCAVSPSRTIDTSRTKIPRSARAAVELRRRFRVDAIVGGLAWLHDDSAPSSVVGVLSPLPLPRRLEYHRSLAGT